MSTEPSVTADVFDLDEWLSTGTLARRSIEMFNNPDLAAEYDVLAIRLEDARQRAGDAPEGEGTLGDESEVNAILAEMEELYARWQASKAVWTVRALLEQEIEAIGDEIPEPAVPDIIANPTPEATTPDTAEYAAHQAAGRAWRAAHEAVIDERSIAMLALAVVEVRAAQGVVTSVTRDQIRALRGRPHGKAQATRLLNAVSSATTGEVDVPRPTSPGRSATVRD